VKNWPKELVWDRNEVGINNGKKSDVAVNADGSPVRE
jgi:hypothetical protein